MNEKEVKIVIDLIDREIDNFKSVNERTGKEYWLDRVKELESIKEEVMNG